MVGTTTGSTLEDGNCTESTSKIKVDQILGEKWKFIQSLHFPLSGANYNDELGLATVGQQISFDNKWLMHATTPYKPKIITNLFKILDQEWIRLKLLLDIDCKYWTAIGY